MEPFRTDMIGDVPPPAGVTPNFVDPSSIGYRIMIAVAICLPLSTLCMVMRTYTRFVIARVHGWEDYTGFAAWLGLLAWCIVPLWGTKEGLGIHQWDILREKLGGHYVLLSVGEIVYAPVIFFVKLSILLQFIRIFASSRSTINYRLACLIIWFNVALYLSAMIAGVFQCIPRSKIWDPSTPGYCINFNALIIASGAVNIVSDIAMLLLPLVSIWRLQMAGSRKLGISAVFAAGFFACFASVTRLVVIIRVVSSNDLTYGLTNLALWTIIELSSGIVCLCLPMVPRFFQHIGPLVKVTTFGIRSRKSIFSDCTTPRDDEQYPKRQSYIEFDRQDSICPPYPLARLESRGKGPHASESLVKEFEIS